MGAWGDLDQDSKAGLSFQFLYSGMDSSPHKRPHLHPRHLERRNTSVVSQWIAHTKENAGLRRHIQSVLGAASLSAFAIDVVALAVTTATTTSRVRKRIDRFSMVTASLVCDVVRLVGAIEVSLFGSVKNLPLGNRSFATAGVSCEELRQSNRRNQNSAIKELR